MADTYEKNLTQKTTLTTSDYIRVVGSDNESYKQLVSDVAKKVIEVYTGSTLAGSAQSVKSAVDALNSNLGGFKEIARSSISGSGSATINVPTGAFLVIAVRVNTSGTTSDGMWIGNSHTSTSHVTTVLSSSTITASFGGQTLTLTNTSGTVLYRAYSL